MLVDEIQQMFRLATYMSKQKSTKTQLLHIVSENSKHLTQFYLYLIKSSEAFLSLPDYINNKTMLSKVNKTKINLTRGTKIYLIYKQTGHFARIYHVKFPIRASN